MFYFHLFLVNIAITVFEAVVEELNNILFLSPYAFWRFLPDEYIHIFKLQTRFFFLLVKARDYSRWGWGLSLRTDSQKREPWLTSTLPNLPMTHWMPLDVAQRTCLHFSTWQWCSHTLDIETWGGDSLSYFGMYLWPLEVDRITCTYQ